jgi:iron complex outermembrane receptor protein
MRRQLNVFRGALAVLSTIGTIAVAQQASGPPAQGATAVAQEDDSSRIAEVVVTAEKRSANSQQVPISISSITASDLEQSGVASTLDLGMKVPSLTLESSFNGIQPHIRGIGTTGVSGGNESSVATYIDDVYIAVMSGAMLSLNNIQQVDVLKGPQGTLFGRNATGGVINVRTKDPSQDFHLDAAASYGNYDTSSGNLYVTGGLTPTIAADLAAYGSNQDRGFGTNQVTGDQVNKTKEYALRTKWLFTPTDNLSIRLSGDISYTDDDGLSSYSVEPGSYINRPGGTPYTVNPRNPFDIYNAYDPVYVFRQSGTSAKIAYDSSFASLVSITGYRTSHKDNAWGVVPIPDPVEHAGWIEKGKEFSQELQLASLPSSPITWVAGLYYLHSSVGYQPFYITGPIIAPLVGLNWRDFENTDAKAAYAQTTLPVAADTHLTLGARYSIERKAVQGDESAIFGAPLTELNSDVLTDAHTLFRSPTWRVALDHQFTQTLLGYVSYNRGFKSGVYDTIPPGGPAAKPVNPETIDAYELGFKTELFDRHLRFNAAAFLYNYKDIQVNIFSSTSTVLENGARARIEGFDFDLTAKPIEHLSLTLSGAYLHDRFLEFPAGSVTTLVPQIDGGGRIGSSGDLAGNRLPYTPDETLNAGVTYTIPLGTGELSINGTYSYNSGWFFGADNTDLRQGAYSLVNGQLSWRPNESGLEVTLWGKNLSNTTYATFFNYANNPYGYSDRILGLPRTYGVTIGFQM